MARVAQRVTASCRAMYDVKAWCGSHSLPCTVATLCRDDSTGNHSDTLSICHGLFVSTSTRALESVCAAIHSIAVRSCVESAVSTPVSLRKLWRRLAAATMDVSTMSANNRERERPPRCAKLRAGARDQRPHHVHGAEPRQHCDRRRGVRRSGACVEEQNRAPPQREQPAALARAPDDAEQCENPDHGKPAFAGAAQRDSREHAR